MYLCGWLTLVRDLTMDVTIESENTWIYFWFPELLYALYNLYILCHRLMLSSEHWSYKSRRNARAILLCTIVWCWGTPSTRVCSGFTAIRFRLKCFMEVIAWTSSWFGRRASIMELSSCRQIPSGMLASCSCSLLPLWPTLDPSPLIAPSFQPWKHMMILKMVIIRIIHVISIKIYYAYYAYYCNYCNYCLWLFCRMVGVCWIPGAIRAWLQETYPVCRSHSEYPGQTSSRTCRGHWHYSAPHAQHLFGRSRRPQAGRGRWMQDVVRQLVGIGMVTWHVINLTGLQRKMPCMEKGSMWWVPCEHDASPCLGHATVCSGLPLTILFDSFGSVSARLTFGRILGSVASRSCSFGGGKDDAERLFLGVVGQNGGAPTTWILLYFCCNRCLRCIRMHSGC